MTIEVSFINLAGNEEKIIVDKTKGKATEYIADVGLLATDLSPGQGGMVTGAGFLHSVEAGKTESFTSVKNPRLVTIKGS